MSKKEKKPRRVRCSTCKQLRDPSSLNSQGQCTTCRKTAQNAKPLCGKTEKKRIAEEVLEAAKHPLPFDNLTTCPCIPATKQIQDIPTMTQTGMTGDATTPAETYKEVHQRAANATLAIATGGTLADRIKQENSKPIVKQKLQPTEEQKAILDAVQQSIKECKNNNVILVEAGAGTGKCLGRGTPVLMYDGSIKPVEEVESNDLLMGPDSLPRTVLQVNQGVGDLYRVCPTMGDSWVCNSDHVLTLAGTNHVFGQIRDVSVKSYLQDKERSVPHSGSWKLLRTGVDFAPRRKMFVPPYLVGLWMGDGSRGGCRITNSKLDIQQYCQKVAKKLGLICTIVPDPRPDKNTSCISFSSHKRSAKGRKSMCGDNLLHTFFSQRCLVGKLKTIPHEYLIASRQERQELLAGIIDTDGESTGNSNTFVCVSGKPYRDSLLFLCRSLGFAAYSGVGKNHVCVNGRVSTYYGISIAGDLASLPTKIRKFPIRRQVKRVNVTGFELEQIGVGEFFGFTLDGDGRFLLGDFTVTHNTATLRMLADVLPGVGQYTAFNAAPVNDNKIKFQGTKVSCNTTHSLAFRAEGKRFAHRLNQGRVRADRLAKMLDIEELVLTIGEIVDEKTKQTKSLTKRLSPGWMASQVMGAIRRFCQSADKQVTADHFRYVDGIDLPKDGHRTYENNNQLREYLLPYAEDAWKDLSNPDGQLPFNHDHYVKIWQLNKPVISANYILLDESQDSAAVLLDVLQQQIQLPNGPLLVLVGDSAQQIYEWRGAINAMAAFPNAPRLFLSQSFRFGEAIANLANKVLETLEEPTPLRLKGLPSIPSKIVPIAKPRAILCRTNALAVASLLEAIAEGRKPFLVGGGSDVIAFVEAAKNLQQLQPTSHPELACFSSWGEVQEYVKTDEDGADLKLLVKLIDGFGADTILSALRAMPEEKDADLVISTAHKCLAPETLVETEIGIVQAAELRHISGNIGTTNGPKPFEKFVAYNARRMLRITTTDGYEIAVTADHGLHAWTGNKYERVEAQSLVPGQFLRLLLGPGISDPEEPAALPDASQIQTDVRAVRYDLPTILTEDCAFVFGAIVADGTVSRGGATYTKSYKSAAVAVAKSWQSMGVPIQAKQFKTGNGNYSWHAGFSSTHIAAWLKEIGGLDPNNKSVPPCIWAADLQCQIAFLRGVFSDGTVGVRGGKLDTVSFSTCFPQLAFDVQYLLRRIGIISRRFLVGTCWRVEMYSVFARRFLEIVGFPDTERTEKGLAAEVANCDQGYLVPVSWHEASTARFVCTKQNARIRGHVSRFILNRDLPELKDRLKFHHDKIVSITKYVGPAVCVAVPDGNRFLQNGFDGWNSKGREWDSVRLAADFPTVSKCCDADRKLLYVAVTRAKLQLDVSDCPFFTGNDSLSIDSILSGQNKPTPADILPPTPSTPPALTTFTWAKSTTENAWLIRGPSGHTGETVDVERRDGSKSRKKLGSAVQEVNGIATYRAI